MQAMLLLDSWLLMNGMDIGRRGLRLGRLILTAIQIKAQGDKLTIQGGNKMHKGVILLIKCDNEDTAEALANDFLESYGEGYVWDWYEIGGRWKDIFGNNKPILSLSECLGVVKEWQQTISQAQEELDKAQKWLKTGGNTRKIDGKDVPFDDYYMYGYQLKIAGQLFSQDFCFDCNVFNLENYDYSIPENVNDYYAVIVDMHN
jgi:hypothetical protein